MKFMKLGSKPDSFQADGDNIRYVASELATDLVVNIGDVKFYLHKFPLLCKCAHLQKLVAASNEENTDEIHIHDIPCGPAAFEICAKFCYGMTVTLNAYNVVAARCAAEYLKMYETMDRGNLVYKIEVFLNSSIFRSWKDSIIVLQTTRSLVTCSEELKLVSRCVDSIALKACVDTSKVKWSYTYNRIKLPSESGKDPCWNGARKPLAVPEDWWVEDLCELPIDLYKRVITTIKTKGKVAADVIGEALNAYALRRLPGFSKGIVQSGDFSKYKSLAETIMKLLPTEKGSVSCSFMLKLLRAAILLECGDTGKKELMKRIGHCLDEATVSDLLIRDPAGETTMYDADIMQRLVEEFVAQVKEAEVVHSMENKFQESSSPKHGPDASRALVAKLVEGYLTEVARDPNLPLPKFVNLAEAVSSFPRQPHDGLYRAIDMYLKEHPGISRSERKRICRLMDCRKLSVDACTHAVQNERLPLRVVVQVLFFEQARQATSSSGTNTPELPGSIKGLLPSGSHGSSRSTTTNTEEDWDSVPTAEDIKALKGELATLRLGHAGSNRSINDGSRNDAERVASNKMKGLLGSKILSRLLSGKGRNGEISSSDTTSPGSLAAGETKSTPQEAGDNLCRSWNLHRQRG